MSQDMRTPKPIGRYHSKEENTCRPHRTSGSTQKQGELEPSQPEIQTAP